MKMKIYITFHISYKYSTYQIFMDTCNQKYQRTYHLVKRQETSYMIIHQEQYI